MTGQLPNDWLRGMSAEIEERLITVAGSGARHALIVWTDGYADVASTMEPADIVAIIETLFGDGADDTDQVDREMRQ